MLHQSSLGIRRLGCRWVLLNTLLFATAAQGQTVPVPTPPAPSTVDIIDDVTVSATAKRYEKSQISAAQRALRIDPTSASSVCFDVRYDDYIENYISAVSGSRERTTIPFFTVADPLGDGSSSPTVDSYFSQNNPIGVDASTDGGAASAGGGCESPLERARVAARAAIARRDKTLPEGYKFYDDRKYPEALASFTKAYWKLPDNDGGKQAALMIGKINLVGADGAPDMKEAVLWLTRAATANFNPVITSTDTPPFDPQFPQESLTPISEAAMALARVYLTGEGVPKDPKAARKWFERASYVGYVPAGKMLGDIHFYGYDTPKDIRKAADYYLKAATVGYAPAQYALAEIYYYGEPGVAADQGKALSWYAEAAKVKHPDALYALAVAYDTGEGVAADPQKALAFYKDAAVAGNVEAQSAMGTYFYEGSGGVAKDDATARKWFAAAAGQGQGDAMFNLGVMTMKGEGGPKDLVRSWVWFRLAKTEKHPGADAALAAVEKQMSPSQRQAALEIIPSKGAG